MIRNIKIYGEKDKTIGGGVTLDDGWITIEGFSVLRDKELLDSKNIGISLYSSMSHFKTLYL